MECPSCGARNKKKDQFCCECGASLRAEVPICAHLPAAGSSNSTFFFLLFLIIAMGAVVLIALLSQGGQQPQAPLIPSPQPSSPSLPESEPLEMTAENIIAGNSIICNSIIEDEEEGSSIRLTIKMEYPLARMELKNEYDMDGQPLVLETILIKEFGGKLYAHNLFGYLEGWWELPSGDDLDIPPPEEIASEDDSYDCNFVPDIPDSELVLPPGTEPGDFSELGIEYLDELEMREFDPYN